MALTTNRKNKMIADWKTGKFKNPTALAKHHKVDRKTAQKVIGELTASNSDIVEIGALYENAKKSLKNPVEIKAVEKAVEERSLADEIEGIIFDGTMINVTGVKNDLSKEGADISMFDRKQAQETFDKAMITVGKANRHAPKQEINLAQQTNTQIKRVSITKRSAS